MQRCMSGVLQPVHFPGFGRGISTRTFQQALSTVRTQAGPTYTAGFGTPAGSSAVLPWFLVSSPSYDRATNSLIAAPSGAPPAGPAHTTGTGTIATPPGPHGATAGSSTAPTVTGHNASASSPPPGTQPSSAPTQNGQPARPWWEE